MVETGSIVKEKSEFIFDAKASGFDKVLGRGNFSKKLTVICDEISESTKQKITEAGGKVISSNDEE